jgi:hypothetical protein
MLIPTPLLEVLRKRVLVMLRLLSLEGIFALIVSIGLLETKS